MDPLLALPLQLSLKNDAEIARPFCSVFEPISVDGDTLG